jgi:hypothetical protein
MNRVCNLRVSRPGHSWKFGLCCLSFCLLLLTAPARLVAAGSVSFWDGSVIPSIPSAADTNAYELGLKFESTAGGYIQGIRFYKGPDNPGPHRGNLWTLDGSNLATVMFTNETATGWQEQRFAAPIPITSNTTYIASYHAPAGGYAFDALFFTGKGHTNLPLCALPSGVDGSNGVFFVGPASSFPTESFEDANYWVDLVYVDSLPPDTNSPMVISITPTNGATEVSIAGAVTITFNEPMNPATVTSNAIFLLTATSNVVPSLVSYDTGSFKATLQPAGWLNPDETYTVWVTGGSSGAMDLATNALAADLASWFTTQLPDQTPPLCSPVNPTAGTAGVGFGAGVTVVFNEPMLPSTINASTFLLYDATGNAVLASVSYDPGAFTATLQPSSPLSLGQTYTAAVQGGESGVTDRAANALAVDFVWSFTITTHYPPNLWDSNCIPVLFAEDDTNAYELGVKFQSAIDGYIHGIRFYKGADNVGPHVGNLWTLSGSNLASITFSNETATGWQEQFFDTPVPIASNTTYIASYHAPGGVYAVTDNFFTGKGHTNYPLQALACGVDGVNGVFNPGPASAFPTNVCNDANYWVDIVFTSEATPAPVPFAITSITVSDELATITWESVSNRTYRLQYKNEITDPVWIELPEDVVATGPSCAITNATGGATHRFYRVK